MDWWANEAEENIKVLKCLLINSIKILNLKWLLNKKKKKLWNISKKEKIWMIIQMMIKIE
jgi:hypothetical protein